MEQPKDLFNRRFIALNVILFFASVTTAAFFQLHDYLSRLHIAPGWFGLIIGADSVASLFLQPVLSPFVNGGNGRRWMGAGILMVMLALLLYGSAVTPGALIGVRLFHGLGFVCVTSALLCFAAVHIPEGRSGEAFGVLSLTRLVPYAVVPPLLGAAVVAPRDFILCLRYACILLGCCLPVLLLLGPRKTGAPAAGAPGRSRGRIGDISEAFRNVSMVLLFALNLLLFSGYTMVFFFLKGFGVSVGIGNPGLFFTIATATMIGVRTFGSRLLDRTDKLRVTAGCMAGLAVCYAFLPHAAGSGLFFTLAFFVGLGWGLVMPLLNALVFDISPVRLRGLNLNLSFVMMQAGFFLGPLAGGLMLAASGYRPLFYLCSVLGCVSVFLVYVLEKTRKTELFPVRGVKTNRGEKEARTPGG